MKQETGRIRTSRNGTGRNGTGRNGAYQVSHRQAPEQLLELAAATTLERIRRDQKRSPVQIRRLLLHLESHLFDSDMDAKQLRQACGMRDNTLPIRFHTVLSLPPYAYIEDCRMEVACHLLRDTQLNIWKIAQLLGYSALQVFSRAFKRWSGVQPTQFRILSANVTSMSLADFLRIARGALEKRQADELSRYLARLYPESFAPSNGSARP